MYNVFQIVVFDSIAVKTGETVCQVTMSNAWVYVTKVKQRSSLQSGDSVAQSKAFLDVLTVGFPRDTKVVLNNAVMELPDLKLPGGRQERLLQYEGDALKQEMKRLGLKPPPNADMNR